MPNFRFAAPNKLFEALAAGKPLITPDIGEIGDLVRSADCGVVMADCSASSVHQAIGAMRDPALRARWTRNAEVLGRTEMNWSKGQEVLDQEYSRLIPQLGRIRSASGLAPLRVDTLVPGGGNPR
jgi:glycosyltransferase involved in cell wall biosynthesis